MNEELSGGGDEWRFTCTTEYRAGRAGLWSRHETIEERRVWLVVEVGQGN